MKARRSTIRKQKIACIAIMVAVVFTGVALTSVLFGTIRTQAAPAEPSYKYYTSIQIQSGETLWSIASTYMTEEYPSIDAYIEEVCSINHIAADEIHAGQYLTVPYYSDVYLQ